MIKTQITQDINLAADTLRLGEIVAIPTETVYGLAGIITSAQAIENIYKVKGRPSNNPLIVHIGNRVQLDGIAQNIPDAAYKLAAAFWPGPLTLVLEKQQHIPDSITAGLNTVAVRMPQHPVALALLRELKIPLAAPSANPFTRVSPTTALHVQDYFNGILPVILDGGPCTVGIESTIVGFENGNPVLYRHGAVTAEQIKSITGVLTIKSGAAKIKAPGMYLKHYAPATPLHITDDLEDYVAGFKYKRIGVLSFTGKLSLNVEKHVVLSQTGNFKEAAAGLYKALHVLDKYGLDLIVAEKFPQHNAGIALNDKLFRASIKADEKTVTQHI